MSSANAGPKDCAAPSDQESTFQPDKTCRLDIDLAADLGVKSAPSGPARDLAVAKAHGLAVWLTAFHFPSRVRKAGGSVAVSIPRRGIVSIQADRMGGGGSGSFEPDEWEKAVRTALKKVVVEDLGDMNATDLEASVPESDADGRGLSDLHTWEKKLLVRVVFDNETGHVFLVGESKKLEKKCFVIRNMLSHYHWRLSGKDVAL